MYQWLDRAPKARNETGVGQHDLSYRLFFVHRLMIRDLLREIVEEPWVERIDLDSGSLAETSFVSAKHESRASDVIWKFQRKDGGEPVHVYVLLEFQSRPDPSMPVRFMGYESLFYQRLMASEPAAAWRKLPPVVPVLLQWVRAVERGDGPRLLARGSGRFGGDLPAPVALPLGG